MILRENETTELKAIVTDDLKKEIIAFANSHGGRIYIGIRDDGTVLGVADLDGTALQISNMIRDAIKPDLTMFIHYETLKIEEKTVVSIDIQQGTERPYYIAKKGLRPEGVYVRQGYSAAPATSTAIRHMIKETDGDHFEEMRSLEQELTFQTTAEEFAGRKLAFGLPQMRTLGITSQDGVYTNLGLLLSDQCVHTIKAAVFEGTTQNEFKDRKEFTGSLLKQMNDVYEYIDFRNPVHSTFDKLRRIDQRSIPEVAVREALLNLLIHREYAFRASALISIYSDRIEFISVGGLVSGVTQNDVMMGISVCRNMNLANVFYRLELIEAYGTGIRKIMNAYEGTGVTPQIETSDNAFKIILPSLTAPHEVKPLTYASEPQESKEEKLILSLQRQGTIRRKDAESLLGESQSSCGRLLKRLTGSGKIVREGNGKNTFYRLP
ncbi:MAG: putative DNA binding domain-containing protein [Lachnospiraceae bacterium]|nr:putative DNA binding domain-containing protein [Lachnospiraceae bacterium]